MADHPRERRIRTRLNGASHTVGIIGWPVAGSLSPVIHNTAFIALELDWVYVPLPVPPGRVAQALAGLLATGFSGANVTMPHKKEVAERMDELSEDAARLRAVNTITIASGSVAGHNTDAPGFDRFLRRDAGFDPRGREALIFGAGGAARACALAMGRAGLRRLFVAVREPGRTEDLVGTLEDIPTQVSIVPFDEARGLEVPLVINATPLGARGEHLPLPSLGSDTLAVDLLYRPAVTPMQVAAKQAGAAAFGGLGLLLHQAALSFELWTGQAPSMSGMSAAALAVLAEDDRPVDPQ